MARAEVNFNARTDYYLVGSWFELFQRSRADYRNSRVLDRPTPTHGHKKLDVQEPGLRPSRGACAEFAGRAPRTPPEKYKG